MRRHLIATQADIRFDAETGTLTVYPAADGAQPALELDMLDPQYLPSDELVQGITQNLGEMGDTIWEAGPLDGLLKSWVHSVSAQGEYSDSLDRPEESGEVPVVHLAPALILRKRTERSFIRAFDEIVDQLEHEAHVGEGLARFVSPSLNGAAIQASGLGDELYFPLPANDEQQRIVKRLAANQGVLVQGPPGTGKSHTIVNLICHALATGQRILVTSHAPRALKVLHGMIKEHAPDVAPLSVVLLGDDREALKGMEESVQKITAKQTDWDPDASRETIERLERELDQRRRREARILAELREIREQETFRHEAKFGYAGTLAQIGERLRAERESLSWIPDKAPEDLDPPLNGTEFGELVSLLRDEDVTQWGADGWVSINVGSLPTAETFEGAVAADRQAHAAYETEAPIRQRAEYGVLRTLPAEDRLALSRGLEEIIQLVNRIDQRPLPWAGTAARRILGDFDLAWRQLRDDTSKFVEPATDLAAWLDRNPVNPDPGSDLQRLRGDAADVLPHLEGGGGWGWGPFGDPVAKRARHIRQIRIGGRLCETADAVRDLVKRLDAEIEFQQLRTRWGPHHAIAATTFSDAVNELKDLCEPIDEAFVALAKARELSAILGRTPGGPQPDWADTAEMQRLRETVVAYETARQYEHAREQIDKTLRDLRTQSRRQKRDPLWEELTAAVKDRDTSRYAGALRQAAGNVDLEAKLRCRRALLQQVEAVAPLLAGQLTAAPADPIWDERAVNFERAWNWRRAEGWLIRSASPGADHQHQRELETATQLISRTLAGLAAEKAWNHSLGRVTEHERKSLIGWQQAMERVGGGRRKYAEQNRREARKHLDASRSAIPAWIMPLYRVAETMPMGPEPLFDIAIIDEASQSGPEALLLAWLARRIVVVGDDQQIHPNYAGVNFQDVYRIRQRYLKDIPFAETFGAQDGSFFHLAALFIGDRIPLREHFRCMPEIIQFSNNLAYASHPLIPLRQYGADRLEPIVTRRVPAGYQRGTATNAVNPPEADALAAEIVRMCGDPAYEGKTIGVISLLGAAQARAIELSLVRDLGPKEIKRRRIVCGDAYAFQGDERDVMLLSLVSAPSEKQPTVRALTGAEARRRFNVAASRARDQMVLFHTPTLNELSANPDCVRRLLLKYCQKPKVSMPDASGIDVPELERIAAQTRREIGNQPPPFESWFELDVFLRIARRGYRVVPQHKVGGYRIDLVIQGMQGSLAVECDGDEVHPPEKYEQDVARQRDLERCDWTFWRVRKSVFRLDPDDALSDLWTTLEDLGIFPTAEEERRYREAKQASEPEDSGPVEDTGTEPARQPEPASDTREPAPEGKESGTLHLTPPPSQPEMPLRRGARAEAVLRELRRRSSGAEPTPVPAAEDDRLAPYAVWTPRGSIPDPRTASQEELVALLTEVVEHEGPVVAIRAYRLINLAAGNQRLSKLATRSLNRACAAAVRTRVLVDSNPLNEPGQVRLVLRTPDQTGTIPRERGKREFDELPPEEVAALCRLLNARSPGLEREALKRQALAELGWVRLTPKVTSFLDRCIDLM
ncbi:MAG: AAA domain-containing protein [Gammaproteobacteria bacterium]|nr:AAA domain-containing protein [Gammaproteobacteria bacterium]